MVAVVQLVEHQVVILGVAGSSPVSHPTAISRDIVDTITRDMVDRYRRQVGTEYFPFGGIFLSSGVS